MSKFITCPGCQNDIKINKDTEKCPNCNMSFNPDYIEEEFKSNVFLNFYQNKKLLYSVVALVILICSGSFYIYNHGRVSMDDWSSISTGNSKETVIEYLGEPKSKTINDTEIAESYHDLINMFVITGVHSEDTESAKEMMNDSGTNVDDVIELTDYINSDIQVEMYTYKLNNSDHYIYFINDQVYAKH